MGDAAQVVEEMLAMAYISEARFEECQDVACDVWTRGGMDPQPWLYATDSRCAVGNADADHETMGVKTGEGAAVRWTNLSRQSVGQADTSICDGAGGGAAKLAVEVGGP